MIGSGWSWPHPQRWCHSKRHKGVFAVDQPVWSLDYCVPFKADVKSQREMLQHHGTKNMWTRFRLPVTLGTSSCSSRTSAVIPSDSRSLLSSTPTNIPTDDMYLRAPAMTQQKHRGWRGEGEEGPAPCRRRFISSSSFRDFPADDKSGVNHQSACVRLHVCVCQREFPLLLFIIIWGQSSISRPTEPQTAAKVQ